MGGACLWSWELTISWLDLAKIMVRSFYPCNIVVVCVMYSLACRSVALHYCGTCVLAFLVMCTIVHHQSAKKWFVHGFGCVSICH